MRFTEHWWRSIEEAIRRGTADRNLLSTPYGNLALMHREMGDKAAAGRMQEMAEKAKGTTFCADCGTGIRPELHCACSGIVRPLKL